MYILQPQRDSSIKTMMSCLSGGFSHFYKQAFPNVESKKFNHGNMKTLTTHYIDAEVVSKGLSMKMF